jgi:hypothetical protein
MPKRIADAGVVGEIEALLEEAEETVLALRFMLDFERGACLGPSDIAYLLNWAQAVGGFPFAELWYKQKVNAVHNRGIAALGEEMEDVRQDSSQNGTH